MITTTIKVSGVKFENEDGTSRQEILGDVYDDYWLEGYEDDIEIKLVREPDNKYDSNAVAIYLTKPEEHEGKIGFVPRENNEFVGEAIEQGRLVQAKVEKMGCAGRSAEIWVKVVLSIRTGSKDEDDDVPKSGKSRKHSKRARKKITDSTGRVYDFGS